MKYNDYCIAFTATVKAALRQLEQVNGKVLCVIEGDRLAGTLTDGDLRRYLMDGGKLEDSISGAIQRSPKTAENRKQALWLLRRHNYPGVPVVGADGKLLDLVLAAENYVFPQLGLPVVIMAGGKGVRLDPYTRVLPKPLIPVGEFPVIEHIMKRFQAYGCKEFHIIVNHKKQLIKAYFNENERQYDIHWYDEDKPLDTGGGLSLLKGHLHGTFFLTNCDILLQSDFEDILRFHQEKADDITMVAANKILTLPYGVVDIGAGGVVEALHEKPEMTFLTNTGMYVLEPRVLEDIESNVPIKFTDIMENQRRKGRKVAVFPVDEDEWLDMGQIEGLEKMRQQLYGG